MTGTSAKAPRLRQANTTESEDDQLKRVQLDMPPKAFERLQSLKIETEASTYAEVIKNALKLYAAIIELDRGDNKLMVQRKDGSIAPLIVFN